MKKLVFDTAELAAGHAADTVAALLAEKPGAVLCLAAGHTSLPVFEAFFRRGLDFSRARFIGLDEWVGVGPEVEGSCASFLERNFFSKAGVRRENIRLFDALAPDPDAECARYDKIIQDLGGIDLQLLGMGRNGHIGFNEPCDAFVMGTHLVDLTESTIDANKRFFASEADVPRQALTMGIMHIMQAKKILVVVSGEDKAEAVAKAFTGPVTPQVPASILQIHPDVVLVGDKAALVHLDRKGVIEV